MFLLEETLLLYHPTLRKEKGLQEIQVCCDGGGLEHYSALQPNNFNLTSLWAGRRKHLFHGHAFSVGKCSLVDYT